VKHDADHLAEDRVAELEIDEELDPAAALGQVGEGPAALEIPERAVQIFSVDAAFARPKRDTAAEAFAEYLEADHQIGLDHLAALGAGLARTDAGSGVPGQELRIAFDIRDQRIHLVGGIGQEAAVAVVRQEMVPELVPFRAALSKGTGK